MRQNTQKKRDIDDKNAVQTSKNKSRGTSPHKMCESGDQDGWWTGLVDRRKTAGLAGIKRFLTMHWGNEK